MFKIKLKTINNFDERHVILFVHLCPTQYFCVATSNLKEHQFLVVFLWWGSWRHWIFVLPNRKTRKQSKKLCTITFNAWCKIGIWLCKQNLWYPSSNSGISSSFVDISISCSCINMYSSVFGIWACPCAKEINCQSEISYSVKCLQNVCMKSR